MVVLFWREWLLQNHHSFQFQFEYLEDIDFNKIFDRYYRSHKARLIKPDGLGIGLFLAQKIIDVHYGKIQALREHNEFVIEITIPTES